MVSRLNYLPESKIVRIDNFSNVTEKYGMIVRRIMKVVGADNVVFREKDGCISMSLMKSSK